MARANIAGVRSGLKYKNEDNQICEKGLPQADQIP